MPGFSPHSEYTAAARGALPNFLKSQVHPLLTACGAGEPGEPAVSEPGDTGSLRARRPVQPTQVSS